MTNLSISLLGSFRATLNAEPLTQFRTKSVQALLIYLVCETERPHQREALMELLWPGMPQTSAQANMRQTLYRLRKLIPEVKGKDGDTAVPFLLTNRQTIQINPDADYALDVAAFTKSEPEQAMALYRGDFLTDFYLPDSEAFEEWVASRRANYRRRILEMLDGETAVHLQNANYDQAIQHAQRQIEIDNLNESSHRQLMEAWARNGRRQEALSHYDTLCQLLQDELAIKPEPETLALIAAIRAGELSGATRHFTASTFSLHDEPEGPKHNLPQRLTLFIGREKEITAVTDLINQHRLVMLTGVGGIGKTNLCLQVGRQMLDAFPDGVWFIELDPIADPALVAQTAAHTLSLRSVSNVPILEVMLNYLKARSCLLILDNCEHLIEAAAKLGQTILHACPKVKILASSREPLDIPGEMLFQVPPLAVPTKKQQVAVENWQEYEALRLFVDRATAILPHFQVTPDNITPLVRICQQLDGIPLALELAAARVKVLTTAQIAARLDDRFRFLTGGNRTALPRHQTLSALIGWSWELLSPDEQLLLQRLSVFAGGMSLEAVEAVCTGEGVDAYDILDLLSELVNKSLVIVQREQGQETRYRLLDTIRQYAQEKLTLTGQVATFRQRHLDYFRALGEAAGLALVRPEQGIWMKRLEEELDNIRAALSWAQEADTKAGLRLANNLYHFWELGYLKEGTSWLAQLLMGAETIEPDIKANALWVRGMLGIYTLSADSVHQLAEESLALYRNLEDQKGTAQGLFLLGTVASFDQGFHKGKPYYQKSLALFRALEDPYWIAENLMMLGFFEAEAFNNYAQALATLKESEIIYRELGHLAGIANVLGYSAHVAIWQGNYALARPMLTECLSIQEEHLGQIGIFSSFVFGLLHYWLGEYDQAQLYLEKSLLLSQQMGDNSGKYWALINLGYVFLRHNNLSRAQTNFSESLQLVEETGVAAGMGTVFAIEGFASLAVCQKGAERATRLFAWADAARETWQNVRPTNEQKDVDRDMAAIREMIDQETFDAASAAGQAMTVEEAMAYALRVE